MAGINPGRLIVMGLVIGVVCDVIENIAGYVLQGRWAAVMASIGRPELNAGQLVAFNVYGLVLGLATAWVYAGIRPRFGPGPRTATFAAVAAWVLGYVLSYATLAIMSVISPGFAVILALIGLVELVVGSIVAMHFYKEA